jgi:tRNA(Ser,Leu) C12 N-acetylase TAN1
MIKVLNKEQKETEVYRQTCDECQAQLEFEYEDTYEGVYGLFCVKCPECGREIAVEKINPIQLTSQNIEFPKHFRGPAGLDIPNEKIQEWIKECLSNAEEDDENGTFYINASGNTVVIVLKYRDVYEIYVSDKYYECAIPR